jgi:hypothetical protein
MADPVSPPSLADKIDRAVQRVTPFAYRMQRKSRRWMRRALRKPRSVAEGPNLLPLLIQVLASFSKADGVLLEEEIDSSLGFLRYDYPEAVYSELRQLFRQALYEQQDLGAMAQKLSASLSADRKIMLGVQLYDLISQAGLKQEQVVAFYSFMSQLGMAAQAIDIVYQLNASEESDPSIYQRGASPLESLSFGPNGSSDVLLKSLNEKDRLLAFRYHELILLKNYRAISRLRSRPTAPTRAWFLPPSIPASAILIGDQVLTYQELGRVFQREEERLAPPKSTSACRRIAIRCSSSARAHAKLVEITFGLKVHVKALREVDAGDQRRHAEVGHGSRSDARRQDRLPQRPRNGLTDLRRRARRWAGRFQLQGLEVRVSRLELTRACSRLTTFLLSPGTAGDVLLKIFCDYDARVGTLEVIEADRPIMVGENSVRGTAR